MDYKMYYLARRNPSVTREEWPKHWRSHPKFVSQFPSIGGRIDKLFYTARVYEPMLDGTPIGLPQVNAEYDGVAVVSSPENRLAVREREPEIHEKIMADERRVFGDYTNNSNSFGRETLVLGGKQDNAAIIRFMRRRPDLSPEAFQTRWNALADRAHEAVDAGKIRRYVHVQPSEPVRPGHEYDGISEAWFASVDDAVRALTSPDLSLLFDPAGAFSDPDRSVTMLTETIYSWPRD